MSWHRLGGSGSGSKATGVILHALRKALGIYSPSRKMIDAMHQARRELWEEWITSDGCPRQPGEGDEELGQ